MSIIRMAMLQNTAASVRPGGAKTFGISA
jgi:hypothetical protein